MNTKEYQQLTYTIIPALKNHFKGKKDPVDVRILQDTLKQINSPFNTPSLVIGVGYKGTGFMDVYSVVNNGEQCSYSYQGQTQI